MNHWQHQINVINDSTYFGILIEYLEIKCTFRSVPSLSKWHYNFLKNPENKAIFRRLITSQIGRIFEISPQFSEYFSDSTTNVCSLISTLYTDFGFIENIAFSRHHDKVIFACTIDKIFQDAKDQERTEITSFLEEPYYNPLIPRYNAIGYDQIPFDLLILTKLRKAELLIHWLKFISTQTSIPVSEITNARKCNKVVFITDICNSNDIGYPLIKALMKLVFQWNLKEFRKFAKFLISNSNNFDAGWFLCDHLKAFLAANRDRAFINICALLAEFNKAIDKNDKKCYVSNHTISYLYHELTHLHPYYDIVTNRYHDKMFRQIGSFLRRNMNVNLGIEFLDMQRPEDGDLYDCLLNFFDIRDLKHLRRVHPLLGLHSFHF